MINLISPETSIDIALAQKNQVQRFLIGEDQNTTRVLKMVLGDLNTLDLFDFLSNINVISYPYDFVSDKSGHPVDVYSFAVLEGRKGNTLDDKKIIDHSTNQISEKSYILPQDAPFIVLSGRNQQDARFQMTSLAHEIAHILINSVENNNQLMMELAKMLPQSLSHISADEGLPILFEAKVLNRLFNGQETVEYLIDRYLPDYDNDIHEDVKNDLVALTSVAQNG